jgi:hypothetical protein
LPNLSGKKIVQRVAESLGKSGRTIWYAMQFAREYPDLSLLPEGKNTREQVFMVKRFGHA